MATANNPITQAYMNEIEALDADGDLEKKLEAIAAAVRAQQGKPTAKKETIGVDMAALENLEAMGGDVCVGCS